MCGICGVVTNGKFNIEESALKQMCVAMAYRGPDDQGIYLSDNKSGVQVGLGHRRLSIIDLSSSAHQPMSNEDQTVWFVGNGEIYNFKELREELIRKGHRFTSHSDIEVALHSYESYGEDFLKYLHGMFALAIWDEKEKKLILARDKLGKKPLVYTLFDGRFVFASEFKALLSYPNISRAVNLKALAYYLRFTYIPAPLTAFENIYKLPPAHLLIYKNGNIEIRKYWGLDFSGSIDISEDEACDRIYELLSDSVRSRLVSDVPLGAFLSGGLDSSTIVAMMSRLGQERVKTFSIGFSERAYNELDYAREVAQHYKTEHKEFIIKPNCLEILPLLIDAYGEPFADSSAIPTYYVSKMTREYVKVALSGDGGDENFGGYERLWANNWADKYRGMPYPLRHFLEYIANLNDNRYRTTKDTFARILRFVKAASLPCPERYEYWLSSIDKNLQQSLYSFQFQQKIRDVDTTELMRHAFSNAKTKDIINSSLFAEVNLTLPYDYLVKVDIASMLNSLEVRCPFLDTGFMEFTAKLPGDFKIRRFTFKYILKKMIRKYDLLPRSLLKRKKMGFAIPISDWLRGELADLVEDNLLSYTSLKRGYFNPYELRKMIKMHMLNKYDYGPQIWTLLVLELWHQRFIDHG